jgi:cytochrome c
MSGWAVLVRGAAGIGATLVVAACASPHGAPARDTAPSVTVPIPVEAPVRFGFGVTANPDVIALWDLDVGPDGVGLPPGQGSVEEGATVFLTRCAACHGVTGTEGPNDRLVGGDAWGDGEAPRPRTIGNYWPYATTLFDYITRAMPQNDPGSLTADETYAVIAWLLARNGVIANDTVLDSAALAGVQMPARYRFVPDDRKGGAVIR